MDMYSSTRDQRLKVQELMLAQWAETEAQTGIKTEHDDMLGRFKAAIDELPDLGDAVCRVNPVFRMTVETLLDQLFAS